MLLLPISIWGRIGYFAISDYEHLPGTRYTSWSSGIGARIRLMPPGNLLKIVDWLGLHAGLAVQTQLNSLDIIPDISTFTTDPLTINDTGISQDDLTILNNNLGTGLTMDTEIGRLSLDPKLTANMGVTTLVLPLEISTAFSISGIAALGLNVGLDISIGTIALEINSGGDINIEQNELLSDYFSFSPARAEISLGLQNTPTLLRPRLGLTLSLTPGPVLISIPVSISLDPDGRTISAGVYVGFTYGKKEPVY